MQKTSMFIGVLVASVTIALKIDAAQQPHFYGKTITLQVGAEAGGRQDRIARTLAKYLAKYTPGNPAFLIQNKSGGQGIPAMLALSKGPTDGSFISMVISSYLEAPYFGAPGATYEPRSFVYIGAPSTGKQRNVLISINGQESRRWKI
jgi:tripartite-type tricarboxylate transporter receptor subunit TctC